MTPMRFSVVEDETPDGPGIAGSFDAPRVPVVGEGLVLTDTGGTEQAATVTQVVFKKSKDDPNKMDATVHVDRASESDSAVYFL